MTTRSVRAPSMLKKPTTNPRAHPLCAPLRCRMTKKQVTLPRRSCCTADGTWEVGSRAHSTVFLRHSTTSALPYRYRSLWVKGSLHSLRGLCRASMNTGWLAIKPEHTELVGNSRTTTVFCAVSFLCRSPVVLRRICACGPESAQWIVEYRLCCLVFILSEGAHRSHSRNVFLSHSGNDRLGRE